MTISIHLTKEEYLLAESFAKKNNMCLETLMKETYFDHIEDEYDLLLVEEALRENKKNPKTYTVEEVEKIIK